MLRSLSASDSRFKTLHFRAGLNLLVADTTQNSSPTDSRNGAGKTSVVELLHFLLGADASKQLPQRPELKNTTFTLEMDWPGQDVLTISRSGRNAKHIQLDPNIAHEANLHGVDLNAWRDQIGHDLFRLPAEHPGVTSRGLLSFLMRRVNDGGFQNPTEWTTTAVPKTNFNTSLLYLLGLNWQLADRYRDIRERDNSRRELIKAAKDPVWNDIVGKSGELQGRINLVEGDLASLRVKIKNFQVVPEYENLKTRADEITQEIQDLFAQDVIDTRNIENLKAALTEESDVEVQYLDAVYQELNITLGEQVHKRYDEVETFHNAVLQNRRHFLQDELNETKRRLDQRKQWRSELGAEQQQALRLLSEGGALESLEILHQAAAAKEAELTVLKKRLSAAQKIETSAREITIERTKLAQDMNLDLSERSPQTSEASQLFTTYVRHLYGDSREAYLAIEANDKSITINPHIAEDASSGIGHMKTFCFDLAWSIVAHRGGRCPNFLVHDGYIYDGVDARQIARALHLAARVMREEGMQYLVTMNSDDLAKAQEAIAIDPELHSWDPREHIIEPRLTDSSATGGLFGFRFDSSGK